METDTSPNLSDIQKKGNNTIYFLLGGICFVILCICICVSVIVGIYFAFMRKTEEPKKEEPKKEEPKKEEPKKEEPKKESTPTPTPEPKKKPTIKFCSQPDLKGACVTYDAETKFYPYYEGCLNYNENTANLPMNFVARSAQIIDDNPDNYTLYLQGRANWEKDTDCGPSKLPLTFDRECYKKDILSTDKGAFSCLPPTDNIDYVTKNVKGGIAVVKRS